MERAGFIGMQRRIHQLVKQAAASKSRPGLFLPSKDAVVTSVHSTGDGDTKLPPGKPDQSLSLYQNYLQSYGGEIDVDSSLFPADPQEIEERLRAPATEDVAFKDGLGWSLLHFAANTYSVETVRRLLVLHADPNAVNCLRRTPLHLAVMRDDAEIATELLTYGANPNLGDIDGWTPAHFAVHLGHLRSLQSIFGFSPDLQQLNKSQKTPKDYIKCTEVQEAVQHYEHSPTDTSLHSQDSTETADISTTDSPHLHFEHLGHFEKVEGHEKAHFRDSVSCGVTFVRAQRPNEESGAIVCPHPNSAYS